MSNNSINAVQIWPNDITASHLQFWDNRFYPIFKWKAYNILFNIYKTPWKYQCKIEMLPIDNWVLKLKTYISTTRILDVIEMINSWKSNLEKHPELIISEDIEDISKWIHWDEILENIEWLWRIWWMISRAKDADEQAILWVDFFERFENLKFLWAASKYDKDKFADNTELFIWQFDNIRTKIKKDKKQMLVLRMLKEYMDSWSSDDYYNTWMLFDVFEEIVTDLNKNKNKNLEDFVYVSWILLWLANKKVELWKYSINEIDRINEMYLKAEEQLSKQREKNEMSIVWIERLYRETRAKEWFATTEKPVNDWKPYSDWDLIDIIWELWNLCSWQWEQSLSVKNSKEVISWLAIEKWRSVWAIIDIFNLCFWSRPFRWEDANNDMNYTMRILIKRNELWLDNFWKSNSWFSDVYKRKLENWNWKEETLNRNISILDNM